MKIRKALNIEGGLGMDCLLHWFCAPCATCQEGREVKGYLEKQASGNIGNNKANLIENQ